ncbi:MAG: ABC transporter permease, partial [bacterium]|nr:ABC transporter permease [bacterium]
MAPKSASKRGRLWPPAVVLVTVYALAIGADFVAPYDYFAQNRSLPFAPPARLHFVDPAGNWHLIPFIHPLVERPGSYGEYVEDRGRIYPVRFFTRGSRRLFGVEEPARICLLGTDGYGRDQLSRLLYGARISLFAGLLAGGLAVALGLGLGAVAGYFGGWIDELLMRAAELCMTLPWLYLLLAVRAFLPLHITPEQAFLLLIAIIGLIGWARPARLIRGVVLSARERDFVHAARGFGAGHLYLLRRHVLPQTFAVALTQLALLIPQYTLAEVTLSFLGLGVAEPMPSWGNMLATLQQYHVMVSYWWMFFPALALIGVILS